MELTIEQTLRQGITAHRNGKLQEAEKCYRTIISCQPQHVDANHNLGVLAVSVGKTEEAIPFFKIALESSPKQAQFWLSYIDALINLGRLDIAKQVLKEAENAGLKGDKFDQLDRQLNGASISIQTTGSRDNPSRQQINNLATLYSQGKLEEALVQGNQLASQFSADPNIPNILGAVYSSLGNHKNAIASYNRAIEVEPNYAEAYNNLGVTLNKLGRNEEAITSLNRAIDLWPNYAEAYNNLGKVLIDFGEYKEAVANLNQAIKLWPDYAGAYNNLGNALENLSKYEEAISSYNKAIELNPDDAGTHNNLGNALKGLGKYEEAISSYNKAIELNPNEAGTHNSLGNALKHLGKYEEAIEQYDLINTPLAKGQSLECHYMLGDYKEFRNQLNILIDTDKINIRAAAVSAFAAQQLKEDDVYPFCSNPLNFVVHNNLIDDNYLSHKTIREIIKEARSYHAKWENRTTKFGYQTEGNIFEDPPKHILKLRDIIKHKIDSYYKKFNHEDCTMIKRWPSEIKLKGWFNRLLSNGYQKSHIHPSGWISGVMYLQTVSGENNDEGSIELGLHGYNYPIIDSDYPKTIHSPREGDILLFPSSLFHRTLPFKKKLERCVIAFDVHPESQLD